MSRILDYLLSETPWKQFANAENVTAIGHSLGGWAVVQLAGARLDRPTFEAELSWYTLTRVLVVYLMN